MISLIILSGLFDRMRGSGWFRYSRGVGVLGMGATLAVLLHLNGGPFALFLAAFLAGAAPGWGNPLGACFDFRPMGANYEFWQIGILRRSVPLALVARGCIWTLPTLVVYPWTHGILIFAPLAALAFPLSVYLARDIPGSRGADWSALEFIRGTLMGMAAYLGGLHG